MRNRTELNFADFKSSWASEPSVDPLPDVFRYFDPTGSGEINFPIVLRLFSDLGYGSIPEKELKILTERLDVDKDGKVSYSDFLKLMQRHG